MSVTFDNVAFDTGQASTGVYLLGTYTGTGLLSGVTPVTIDGTINNPGSIVSVNINTADLTAVGVQGTYLGFSQIPDTADYTYYFSVTGAGIATPVQIAVSGSTLPALNVATPITTANISAPVGPATPCFVTGTYILTTNGNVAVEDLKVGDLVITASGTEVPVQWIGHQTVRCERTFDPKQVWPVRICANAFGDLQPERDLFVSPGHALWVPFMGTGVLIPALSLVNDATVAQVKVDEVSYWHIELASHDILLANGLPAESYIDVDNRSFFNSSDGYLPPEHTPRTIDDYCRPFFAEGPIVEAVHKALRERALSLGWTLDIATEPCIQIIADGKGIAPTFHEQKARFFIPVDAEDVWLVSETIVPSHVAGGADHRALGLHLQAMSIDDGISVHRQIALDDSRLCVGFHWSEENGTRRWTAGRARLPANLWQGCRDIAILQISFTAPNLPRWIAPLDSAARAETKTTENTSLPRTAIAS